jgi:hypothetical protein
MGSVRGSARPGRAAQRALLFAGAWLLGSTAAAASNIEVKADGCRAPVAVKARDARLSEVLARLSQALDFKLRMEGGADPLLNLEMTAPGPELVAALAAQHGSFMIQHARDARCPGATRVATVWLAAKGKPGMQASTTAAKPAAPPRHAVVPVTETATPERLRQADEDARRRKQAYETYVRRHGQPPPGEPEEAATPVRTIETK